ncbi:hypothetical protein PR048_025413 [Dryococelus australis]|uniref:Uncharacterized protein n=1 Tax=Dryococelus australis TaxID=614101 RepID=A0ABQ9GR96_9NEOP|nr:hypothetical protein PR048_025413 [Dryococelus australis]
MAVDSKPDRQTPYKVLKAVQAKASTFEINFRKKSLPLPAYILTGAMSGMRPCPDSHQRLKGSKVCLIAVIVGTPEFRDNFRADLDFNRKRSESEMKCFEINFAEELFLSKSGICARYTIFYWGALNLVCDMTKSPGLRDKKKKTKKKTSLPKIRCRLLLMEERISYMMPHTEPVQRQMRSDTKIYLEYGLSGRENIAQLKELANKNVILITDLVFRELSVAYQEKLSGLYCSLPIKANQVRVLVVSLQDFRKWESCRTMPLVGGAFLGDLPFPRLCIPTLLHSQLISPTSALKNSLSRAAQISRLELNVGTNICKLVNNWEATGAKCYMFTKMIHSCVIPTFPCEAVKLYAVIKNNETALLNDVGTIRAFFCGEVGSSWEQKKFFFLSRLADERRGGNNSRYLTDNSYQNSRRHHDNKGMPINLAAALHRIPCLSVRKTHKVIFGGWGGGCWPACRCHNVRVVLCRGGFYERRAQCSGYQATAGEPVIKRRKIRREPVTHNFSLHRIFVSVAVVNISNLFYLYFVSLRSSPCDALLLWCTYGGITGYQCVVLEVLDDDNYTIVGLKCLDANFTVFKFNENYISVISESDFMLTVANGSHYFLIFERICFSGVNDKLFSRSSANNDLRILGNARSRNPKLQNLRRESREPMRVKQGENGPAPECMGGGGEIFSEKTHRPAASSGTIPTCGKPGMTRPGIEPSSSRWEASILTAQPPRPTKRQKLRRYFVVGLYGAQLHSPLCEQATCHIGFFTYCGRFPIGWAASWRIRFHNPMISERSSNLLLASNEVSHSTAGLIIGSRVLRDMLDILATPQLDLLLAQEFSEACQTYLRRMVVVEDVDSTPVLAALNSDFNGLTKCPPEHRNRLIPFLSLLSTIRQTIRTSRSLQRINDYCELGVRNLPQRRTQGRVIVAINPPPPESEILNIYHTVTLQDCSVRLRGMQLVVHAAWIVLRACQWHIGCCEAKGCRGFRGSGEEGMTAGDMNTAVRTKSGLRTNEGVEGDGPLFPPLRISVTHSGRPSRKSDDNKIGGYSLALQLQILRLHSKFNCTTRLPKDQRICYVESEDCEASSAVEAAGGGGWGNWEGGGASLPEQLNFDRPSRIETCILTQAPGQYPNDTCWRARRMSMSVLRTNILVKSAGPNYTNCEKVMRRKFHTHCGEIWGLILIGDDLRTLERRPRRFGFDTTRNHFGRELTVRYSEDFFSVSRPSSTQNVPLPQAGSAPGASSIDSKKSRHRRNPFIALYTKNWVWLCWETRPFVLREYVYVDALGRLDVYFMFPEPLHAIIRRFMDRQTIPRIATVDSIKHITRCSFVAWFKLATHQHKHDGKFTGTATTAKHRNEKLQCAVRRLKLSSHENDLRSSDLQYKWSWNRPEKITGPHSYAITHSGTLFGNITGSTSLQRRKSLKTAQGATVAERLARSPPTKGEPGSIPGLVTGSSPSGNRNGACHCSAGFIRPFPFPPPPASSFLRRSIFTSIALIGSQNLAVKSRPIVFSLTKDPGIRTAPQIDGAPTDRATGGQFFSSMIHGHLAVSVSGKHPGTALKACLESEQPFTYI